MTFAQNTFAQKKLLLGLFLLLPLAFCAGVDQARAQDVQDRSALWADFNHYVKIARPDLAQAAASALLAGTGDQELLDVVEASDYKDYQLTLQRAASVDMLQETSRQLESRIQAARIKRSREPKRILADIGKLAEGKRANLNATARLKAAGQNASPYLLATLLDEDQQELHSLVLTAMVSVGRPLVYPLSVALPDLEPVPMGQIALVLSEIGYPEALPYIRRVLEDTRLNPTTTSVLQTAYDRLIGTQTVSAYATASDLFLNLGWKQYMAAPTNSRLAGYDPATDTGLIWEYDREAGLISIPVPGTVYSSVLAMRSAQQALRLDPQMDSALSLWLMANLRRENRMPKGTKDKSYPSSMHPPSFYIKMAGPLRQHDVLDTALNGSDVQLALDAITALAATAGTEALINREGTAQPLLRALAFPDRRVRFNAAFAMTNARPRFSFPGSDLIVPVLAEAVRQSPTRHAVTISGEMDTLNKLKATVREVDYQPIGGQAIDEVATQINASPGVDLIAIQDSAASTEALYRQTAADYRLANVPIVAIVSALDKADLNRRLPDSKRLFLVDETSDPASVRTAFDQASQANIGAAISEDESTRFALTALGLLRSIAASANSVYNVLDALPTLIQALGDSRQEIAAQAASVVSLIDDPSSQRALGDAALDTTRPLSLRVAFLESLSESARFYGSYLSDIQLARLLDLVKTGRGDLVNAAAQAHGALTLPTSDVVQLIVQ